MNIYRCISEPLTETIPLLDDGTGPIEEYCIAELVAAETPSKAKWLAAQSDRNIASYCSAYMSDMPKFSIVCTRKNLAVEPGVITSTAKPAWWKTAAEVRQTWRERREHRLFNDMLGIIEELPSQIPLDWGDVDQEFLNRANAVRERARSFS